MKARKGPFGNLEPLISCGGWPCLVKSETYLSSLLGMLLANALSALLLVFGVSKEAPPAMLFVTGGLLALADLSFLLTAFLNPGIAGQQQGVTERYCPLCDLYQEDGQKHC
jgi:hypothetical protein